MESDNDMMDQVKLDSYDKKSQKIIQLIDKLRDEGAQFDINLPTVVFCGNQSAGKSSLIEAISGINLPRSDGTCTRCPMELRLSDTSDKWSCSISLQFKYDEVKKEPLGKPHEVIFQENITDLNLVELVIRRAQKAILNPGQNPLDYLKYQFLNSTHDERIKEIKSNALYFTENIILIKIFGAKRNLTLIDLPGIIRVTESQNEQGSINLIEKLVKNYIKNPRSLIIATISCKDEIENQAIMSLANEVDPNGLRTIGVLTKPDTIESNCHDSWLQVLNNQSFFLELGYFIIKNPSKKELDAKIGFIEARYNETIFFNSNHPWSTASATLKNQMGVDNLRDALSNQLTCLIEESLPAMRSKINVLLESTTAELKLLPPSINKHSKFEFISLIRDFSNNIKNTVNAKSNDKSYFQKINLHFQNFNKHLISERPILHLPEITNQNQATSHENEETMEYYVQFGDDKSLAYFTVKELQIIIDKQKGRELSNFIKNEVVQEIVQVCQKNWHRLALDCLHKVEYEIKELIKTQIKIHFGRFKVLMRRIEYIVNEIIQSNFDKASNIIKSTYEMEIEFPVTWDNMQFDKMIQKIRVFYDTLKAIVTDYIYTKSKNRHRFSQKSIKEEENSNSFNLKLIPLDVQTIVEISQAYYRLAQGRYGDIIPMMITKFFIHRISSNLEKHIVETLNILEISPEDSHLLEEDPKISKNRKDCTSRLERLQVIKKSINE